MCFGGGMVSNPCEFVKRNNERCKRSVATGQKFCWQHSHGLRAKWRSLTRNQTIGFCIAAASLTATLWFGISSQLPKPTMAPTVNVQSSGDQSPNVVDNKGKVDIQNQQSTAQQQKRKQSAQGKQ
jgi:hypothetical protein